MINYVFASEFDILKGCLIRAHYPQSFVSFNDGMLASYMIPDGAHKHETDLNVFRYKLRDSKTEIDRQSLLVNTSQICVKTLKFDPKQERWEPAIMDESWEEPYNIGKCSSFSFSVNAIIIMEIILY